MRNCKCTYKVFDITTKRNRLCKLPNKFNGICHVHLKHYGYPQAATKIQAIWKGYRSRTKVSKLFVNLPSEIQDIVLGHMMTNYNIFKLNRAYKNVYFIKLVKIRTELNQRWSIIKNLSVNDPLLYLAAGEYNVIESKYSYLNSRYEDLICNF
jgi:hypothetical protein